MHNLRTIFLCVLFVTQTFTMELSQNSNNKKTVACINLLFVPSTFVIKNIIIPVVKPVVKLLIKTLKQLSLQCVINCLKTYDPDKIKLPNELEKELARQYYLQKNQYILGLKEGDFTLSLAELVNYGRIIISSGQKKLDLVSVQIGVIHSLTLRTIADECLFLRYLDLSDNQLTKIPKSIGLLTTLRRLNLNENQLTKLPDSFGRLTNLTELCLEKNQIVELPNTIGQLTNLELLIIENNKISKLPDYITKLVRLEIFDLFNNLLPKKEKERICTWFNKNKSERGGDYGSICL